MLCWGAVKWVPETTAYDEAFDRSAAPRSHYRPLVSTLESFTLTEIARRERLQKISLVDQGITFTVYGEKDGLERIFPFDFVPRIIPAREWERIEAGLIQRVTALNLFIADVYQEQKCLKDKVIPAELVLSRKEYKRELLRVTPPRQIYTHVVGTDIIRNDRGEFLILEDNCRCPSGVSYVLENRNLLHRVFPEFFTRYPVRSIRDYPRLLLDTLLWSASRASENPVAVVLTPGIHNSAYFEHSFLAREMGVFLVEGRDLIVEDSYLYMRTTDGRQRVDVIYRRVDEDFLDPLTFRRTSLLGVPGLMNVYRQGNVAIANAPGAGVADDKAVYAYMPALIKYYLDQEPLLGQVPTYVGPAQGRLRVHARQPGLAGGEDHRRLRRLQHADGALRHPQGDRRLRHPAEEGAGQLHRPAAGGAVVASDLGRRLVRAAADRPAALHPLRRNDSRAARAVSPEWRCVPAPTS